MHPSPAHSSDSALRLAVDVRRLPWIRRLAVDYAYAYERLAPFFAGDPAEPTAWIDAVERVTAVDRPRAAIAATVVAQHERRGAPPEAVAAAQQLADPRAVAVVTGQQAGLFGGPLFTLLKAVTAVRLAHRVTTEHGVPAVAVFWIDAEDHDWEEIRSCAVLDGELALREATAPAPEGAGHRTVAALRWPDGIADAVASLSASLPPTEFTGWVVDLARLAYAPGLGVADSFARWLDAVLGPHGLVVYDASDPAAKPFASEIFAREIEQPGRTSLAAARAGADLVAAGYHMQVTPSPESLALFHLDGGRRPIRQRAGGFAIGDEPAILGGRDLISRARSAPAAFSPNVLLRPIVQDTIFPTVCYVAGPNELAYLAQLRSVYEAFGVPMPLVHPRATATLLDAGAGRFLTRYRVPLEDLQAQDESALNTLLKALLPPAVERTIAEAEVVLAERLEAVIAAVPAIDPTLEGKARSVLGRMQHELSTLHAKVLQAAKRRDETLRRQFTHAQLQAFPHGHPQERAVGGVSFLNRYGPALVTRLLDELPVDAGTHWVITI